MFFAGVLTLIRPELFFCGLFLLVLLVVTEKINLKKKIQNAGKNFLYLMCLPLIVYGYLALRTRLIIPTSISARASTANEYGVDWVTEIGEIFSSFSVTNSYFFIVVIAILIQTIFFAFNYDNASPVTLFSVSGLPLVVGLLVSPTSQYYGRYAIPLLAFAIPSLLFLAKNLTLIRRKNVNQIMKILIYIGCVFVMTFLIRGSAQNSFIKANEASWDWILLSELEDVEKDLKWNRETVLLNYEIQGQWSTNASMISMDGIVGRGEFFGVLNGEQTFVDFLHQFSVDYIVTMNAMKYRPVLERLALGRIFEHDYVSQVGSQIKIEGVTYLKAATNRCLTDNRCYSDSDGQRYLSTSYGNLSGNSLAWNSVYRVILD
jgi:hypothetical protein